MELPPGYRFRPDDIQLISYYLYNKLSGDPICCHAVIDCDVYEFEPWRLFEIHAMDVHTSNDEKTMELYAFVRRRKMCDNGTRPRRSAGNCGCWKATGGNVRIFDKQGSIIGFKRTLSYTVKEDLKVNQEMMNWVMHEYTLPAEGKQFVEWSLCRIKKRHVAGEVQPVCLKKRKVETMNLEGPTIATSKTQQLVPSPGGQTLPLPQSFDEKYSISGDNHAPYFLPPFLLSVLEEQYHLTPLPPTLDDQYFPQPLPLALDDQYFPKPMPPSLNDQYFLPSQQSQPLPPASDEYFLPLPAVLDEQLLPLPPTCDEQSLPLSLPLDNEYLLSLDNDFFQLAELGNDDGIRSLLSGDDSDICYHTLTNLEETENRELNETERGVQR